jgi:tripartite-type tricarboxylate transporter receptor subunit TctC
MVHVPYKSANEAVKDLLAGRVQVRFGNVPATLPHIQAGTLRALAIVGKQRLTQLPDVPSIAEVGYPDIDVPNWTAFVAPAGTPKAVVEYLEGAIGEAMKQPAVRDRMTRFATVIDVQGPDALGKLISNDVTRWAEVIRSANIKGNE